MYEERRIIFVYKLLYCRTSFRDSGLWKLSRHGKCIKSGRTYEEKICDYSAYKKEVRIPNLDTMPVGADENGCNDFALSTFIRMLYSCLVDADFWIQKLL